MPYREKRIFSREYLEVEIYQISDREKIKPRSTKLKESRKEQKNLNDQNAIKHLVRLANNNFGPEDLSLHLTYAPLRRPETVDQAQKDVTNYLARLKRYRKKNGLPDLKYIAVIEKSDEGWLHHHLIINDMDRDAAETIWKAGRANADRLKPDEYGLEGLVRYITKDPQGNKRWSASKNLIQPEIRVRDAKFTKREVDKLASNPEDREKIEKLYEGYCLTSTKVKDADMFNGTRIAIKMRRRC